LLKECGPALVLAVYRCTDRFATASSDEWTFPGYNITVPESTFVLESNDLLTVLAPPAFGMAALAQNLLPGFESFYELRASGGSGRSHGLGSSLDKLGKATMSAMSKLKKKAKEGKEKKEKKDKKDKKEKKAKEDKLDPSGEQ
jgi:hypothetical protein